MPERLTLEEFAELTHCPAPDIERYRDAGLLDPERDGLFDDADVFRLQIVLNQGPGFTPEQIANEARKSDEGRKIFGMGGTSFMPEEIASRVGLEAEQLRTLGTILGYDPDQGASEETLGMLETVGQMIAGGLPWEAILEGARVYADALGRMADMGIQLTHRYACEPLERSGHDPREIALLFGEIGNVAGPTSEKLITAMYQVYMRRALAAHAREHLEPQEEGQIPGSVRRTILFVDLALFSSLADVEGDEAAMRVIDRFDHTVREFSLRHDGRLVKQIGDEFMLVFRDPAAAVRFAVDVHETMSRTERFLALRTGIHSGSVLHRFGDYYGHAVNVASRTASMAMPNAILVTEPVAKAAADAGIEVEEIGVRSLRGMEEPLALYRVVR